MPVKVQARPYYLKDPRWQAGKAGRRALAHAEAVRESAEVTHLQWRLMNRSERASIDLYEILRRLRDKKVPFVLTGAHSLGGWTGRPRATRDVDILCRSGRNHARAVKAIQELYPFLEIRTFRGLTAFFLPGETESVIDVAYPHRDDHIDALESAVWVEDKGLRFRIPALEHALASKYGALLNPERDPLKRAQDAVDFSWMVRHSLDEAQHIDLKKLTELGEKVWPGGGGHEIVRLVDEVKAGGLPSIRPRAVE